ncbi:hypothetical protein E2C01_085435 [Portunus trituberculatus]|uniref:Uncharacterized protein n=1 Tax=Portunus trituberculatus TaxID=210409 RepID=A0A5B7JAG9_PORTR|nr:hypothetical protein [Portunus trituberculatus]
MVVCVATAVALYSMEKTLQTVARRLLGEVPFNTTSH